MAVLDRITKRARQWDEHAARCGDTIMRAAAVQGRGYSISAPGCEAKRLAALYTIRDKHKDWREYGDVALHLAAAWPPDLAYSILYALRELQAEIGYDPVPLTLKAVEMLYYLRCERIKLHLERTGRVCQLMDEPVERAKCGARIIARELSVVPLRWASGIYDALDPGMKPFVQEQLREFNPKAADILLKSRSSRLLTRPRLLRLIFRVLFGRQ
ncbi:MAG: hypothetical protein HY316_04735 [Acidobacteria bacterium]|nr:hypothetical protein [Acidobacteriota bacterium]